MYQTSLDPGNRTSKLRKIERDCPAFHSERFGGVGVGMNLKAVTHSPWLFYPVVRYLSIGLDPDTSRDRFKSGILPLYVRL